MVSGQVVNDTVKRMLLSNIDEETIVSTLTDIGIDEQTAKEIIKTVASGSTQPSPQSNSKEERVQTIPPINYDTDTKIKTMQNELYTQGERSDLHETATHTMLNDHAQKLDEMNKKVGEVHKAISTPQNIDASLKVKLTELEQKVSEISAQTNAMMDVMKKILEANRNILTELKSK